MGEKGIPLVLLCWETSEIGLPATWKLRHLVKVRALHKYRAWHYIESGWTFLREQSEMRRSQIVKKENKRSQLLGRGLLHGRWHA